MRTCLQVHQGAALGASELARLLADVVRDGLADLPLPAGGRTLARWQALAAASAFDLSFAKLYEGHTDAVAILQALGAAAPPLDSTWGMWAAEAPGCRVTWQGAPDDAVTLHGVKAWCSGAASLTHGLLTVWNAQDDSAPRLAAVALDQPGVSVDPSGWCAVGMAGSESVSVRFESASATLVGQAGDYLSRPGFWQGGVGIAACWHGGATGIAEALRAACGDASRSGWHRLLALGAVDVALTANATLLREAAAWIDAHPNADAQIWALRVRAATEAAAHLVLDKAGRALGAAPFCRDAHFARLAADLPVFMRQSHADRDLVALGERLAGATGDAPWAL